MVRPAPTGGYALRHVDDAQVDRPRGERGPARGAGDRQAHRGRRVQAPEELTEPAARLGAQGCGRPRSRDRDELPLSRRRRPLVSAPGGEARAHEFQGERREAERHLQARAAALRPRVSRTRPAPAARTRSASREPSGTWTRTTPLGIDRGEGEIPCPEPCSIFVSFARRVRLFEREKRDSAGLSPSEREDLAALVEAAATGEVAFAREAEFEKPLNERRMRYRRLTLVPRLRQDG